jgi:hypothetical protein
MAKNREEPFIEVVQAHERAWGTESYPGRPSLAELLSAPVVLLWQPVDVRDTRTIATVHQDLDAVNKYVNRIVLYSRLEMPKHRLAAIYISQKKANIRGVQVEIG